MEARSDVPQKLKFRRRPLPVDKANLLMEARNASDGAMRPVRSVSPGPLAEAPKPQTPLTGAGDCFAASSHDLRRGLLSIAPYRGLASWLAAPGWAQGEPRVPTRGSVVSLDASTCTMSCREAPRSVNRGLPDFFTAPEGAVRHEPSHTSATPRLSSAGPVTTLWYRLRMRAPKGAAQIPAQCVSAGKRKHLKTN